MELFSIKKKFNSIIIQSVFITTIMLSIVVFKSNGLLTVNTISFICTIAFLVQIIYLIKLMGDMLNPVVIFSIILHLFSSGQILLYVLNLDRGNFDIYNRLSNDYLLSSIVFLTVAYSFYQLGVIFVIRKKTLYKKPSLMLSTYRNQIIYKIGLIIFLIGVVPYMYNLIYSFIFIITNGYAAYYNGDVRLNNLFVGLGYFIYPGLVFIVVGGKRLLKKFALLFLGFIAMISLLSGDRGTAIVNFLSLYMLYVIFLKDGEYNKLSLILFITLLSSTVPIVAVFRHNATISDNINYTEILSQNNIFVSTLGNLGGTLWPLGKIMELIPIYNDFLFGASYIVSIIYLLPSFLRIGPLSDIPLIVTGPGSWLMKTLNMTYGPGFTPFAESYLNFGWFGVFFMFIYGVVFTKLLIFTFRENTVNLPLSYGIRILNFLFFAMSVRGSINVTLAFFVRYVLVPLLILKFISNSRGKRGMAGSL